MHSSERSSSTSAAKAELLDKLVLIIDMVVCDSGRKISSSELLAKSPDWNTSLGVFVFFIQDNLCQLGSALQIWGRYEVLAWQLYWLLRYEVLEQSKNTSWDMIEKIPNFYGTCIVMSRIKLCRTRCSAIAERPCCRVRYSFFQK